MIINKSLPTIIEFNGLPGSGKSTIANSLISELEELDYKLLTYAEIFEYKKNNLFLIIKLLFSIRHVHFLFIWYCIIVLKKSLINIREIKKILHFLNHITLLKWAIKKHENIDFIIIDQGNIQNLLSIAHFRQINNTKVLGKLTEKFNEYFNNYMIVNTHVNVEVTINRITKSKHGTSRYDNLEKIYLKNILKIKKEYKKRID